MQRIRLGIRFGQVQARGGVGFGMEDEYISDSVPGRENHWVYTVFIGTQGG